MANYKATDASGVARVSEGVCRVASAAFSLSRRQASYSVQIVRGSLRLR